ncbi:MAG: sodium:proton antiporter, partial [Acidiphilium sp. 21-66-27]
MHAQVSGLAALAPFFGTLASFALLPGLAPRVWHRHMVRISLAWVALGLVIGAAAAGPAAAAEQLWHSGLVDFLPFIAVLMALYTLGGGVLIAGGPWGRPGGNLLLLAVGTL